MRMTALTAALGLTLGVTAISAGEQPRPRTHTVVMEDMVFKPAALVVASGDTIVWVNKDLVPHTATSRAGGFDSNVIAAEGSWKYTVRKKGAIAYLCTLHPEMKGTLRVK